ncbi:hypothetical protein G6F68_018213 [Rhizopus microsporus]|nr:hypothetical protein G6F68_018213 [Rhizopus microsporus]
MTSQDNFSFVPLVPANSEKQGRIISITHQIPWEIIHNAAKDNKWSFRPRHEHAAMYAGIQSLADEWKTLSIGWTGQAYEGNSGRCELDNLDEQEKETIRVQLEQEYNCIPLFLDNESVLGHYHGFWKTCKV